MAYSCPVSWKEIAPLLCVSVEKLMFKHVLGIHITSESWQLPVCTRAIGSKVRITYVPLKALQRRARFRNDRNVLRG